MSSLSAILQSEFFILILSRFSVQYQPLIRSIEMVLNQLNGHKERGIITRALICDPRKSDGLNRLHDLHFRLPQREKKVLVLLLPGCSAPSQLFPSMCLLPCSIFYFFFSRSSTALSFPSRLLFPFPINQQPLLMKIEYLHKPIQTQHWHYQRSSSGFCSPPGPRRYVLPKHIRQHA